MFDFGQFTFLCIFFGEIAIVELTISDFAYSQQMQHLFFGQNIQQLSIVIFILNKK